MARLHGRGAHYIRLGKTDPVRYGEEPDKTKGTYVYGETFGSSELPADGHPTGRVIRISNGRPEGYKYTSGGVFLQRKRKRKRNR